MSADVHEQVLAVVQGIYEAALDSSRWQQVLVEVSALVRARAGAIWIHDFSDSSASFDDTGPNVAAFSGFHDAELATYAGHYSEVNVWSSEEDKFRSGAVVTSSMLYPDCSLKRTEFFGDWLRPQDLFYSLGSVVDKQDTRAVKLSFLRAERAGAYEPHEQAIMRMLMPHLQTAVRLHRRMYRLRTLSEAAVAGLDALNMGVVLLDVGGKVLHANRAAGSIARTSGAFSFTRDGAVRACSHADTGRLAAAIARAARTAAGAGDGNAGEMLKLAAPRCNGLNLFVAPLPLGRAPFSPTAAVALFFSDPKSTVKGLVPSLVEVYGMTPAEACLTEALVNGKSLQQVADERCTTLNTVRTQLRAASAKAGAKRQVDLVRIVLTGPAVLKLAREPGAGS